MEGLALDRMRAKTRLNKQISAACEILKKEFNDDKSCAREMQEKRHNKGGDKVIAIVDSLEAEHQNRSRSDVRTVSTVAKKHSGIDGAILTERDQRLASEHELRNKIEEGCQTFSMEVAQEKKLRNESAKNTIQGFRNAVHKLAGNLDDLSQSRQVSYEEIVDREMLQVETLERLIKTEAENQRKSETNMTQLLEGMHQKLHRELMQERTERQNTERVLMKLLEESVESIAIKADEATLAELRDLRQRRSEARLQRDKQMAQRALSNSSTLGSLSLREEQEEPEVLE